jgi:Fe-S cluster biogenesis protein NfuA
VNDNSRFNSNFSLQASKLASKASKKLFQRGPKQGIISYRIITVNELSGGFSMTKEQLEEAIKQVRPALQRDGGDIELVGFDDGGTVKVRLKGACGSCPMSTMTLKMGVEKFLKQQIPEVKEVVQVA